MKKIIILLMMMFLITGCFDCQELNNINVVTGMGFDMDDGEYLVSLEVTKSSSSDKGNEISTEIFSAKDKVLAKAMAKVEENSNKKPYYKHVNAIVISQDIAKEGISQIMDYLLRNSNFSTTFFTVICENAKDLLEMKLKNDSASNLIVSTITSHIDAEVLNNVDIITSNIIDKRKDIALPYVEIIDDDKILIENKAYFNEDKMINTINNKMYNFLYLGNKNVIFDNDDNVLNIYNKKVKYDVKKDKIIVNVSGEGRVVSLNENIDINKTKDFLAVEKMINEQIEDEINNFLDETLKDGSDLVGFEDLYYKKYRKEIKNIDYEVKANIKLVRNSVTLEVIHD